MSLTAIENSPITDTNPSPAAALPENEQLSVRFSVEHTYAVHFTNKVFDPENLILARTACRVLKSTNTTLLFIIDQGVLDNHPELTERISNYCRVHRLASHLKILSLPGGEAAKTQQQVERLHREMLRLRIDRQSLIVAIGGGAVLDSAGYAATTFHRGVQLIRMPTTVLAQNDAGIGVKNGINAYGIKNLIGCFSPPSEVINDSHWLATLPDRDFRSGFSEAVKVALIRDGRFYQWLQDNADRLNARDDEACHYLIKRCAELHLHQISRGGDPFEKGSSRPLDYGHWAAHKLESLSEYQLSHGEAVAIGMVLDAVYACEMKILSQDDLFSIIDLLGRLGFLLWHPALVLASAQGENLLLAGLEEFRQHLGGKLCITMLTGLGTAIEVDEIDHGGMLQAIRYLQQLSGDSNRQ